MVGTFVFVGVVSGEWFVGVVSGEWFVGVVFACLWEW